MIPAASATAAAAIVRSWHKGTPGLLRSAPATAKCSHRGVGEVPGGADYHMQSAAQEQVVIWELFGHQTHISHPHPLILHHLHHVYGGGKLHRILPQTHLLALVLLDATSAIEAISITRLLKPLAFSGLWCSGAGMARRIDLRQTSDLPPSLGPTLRCSQRLPLRMPFW